MKIKLYSIRKYFTDSIWEVKPKTKTISFLYTALQITLLAYRGVVGKNVLIRTSALAYSTILALIPLLALLFALFKGFGLQRFLASHLLPELAGGSQDFARQILDYVESTQVASLGIFGVVWLLVALVIVMTNVEKAFNETWGVTRTRPWWRKLSDYLSIFLIFPVLMAVIISITSTVHSHPLIQQFLRNSLPEGFYSLYMGLISFWVVWVAFIFIYVVMPNTRIRLVSAVIGGVVGGTVWQLAQWLFLWFQTSVPYYNVIFGALYQILFLVIWMFWSWLIVLFGAEVAYVHQNLPCLRQECSRPPEEAAPELEYLGLAALLSIADRFARGQEPLSLPELAAMFHHRDHLAADVARLLQDCGFIAVVQPAGGHPVLRYLPRLALDGVQVSDVLDSLRARRHDAFARSLNHQVPLLAALQQEISRTPPEQWRQLSVAALLQHLQACTPSSPGASAK